MNKQPLFSVLIANYNNGKYLMEAIESIRLQTYAHWEIVLVDDGSTDNSREVYTALASDDRIHIFYNEMNMGCAYTKHQCVLYAKGVYCGYLDPDDVLLPKALQITVEALTSNPKAALTMSRYYKYDAELKNMLYASRALKLQPGESYLEHHEYQPEVFSGWSREAYLKSGGLDVSYKAGVDQDLYFRLEEQGEICIIDEFTYKYRENPRALTSEPLWCEYWNIIARHAACVRRGLPVKTFAYADFRNIIMYEADLEVSNKIRTSKQYKLGSWILHPIKNLKQRLKNK